MNYPKYPIIYVVVNGLGDRIKLFGDEWRARKFANSRRNSGSYELYFQSEEKRNCYLIQRKKEGVPISAELAAGTGACV